MVAGALCAPVISKPALFKFENIMTLEVKIIESAENMLKNLSIVRVAVVQLREDGLRLFSITQTNETTFRSKMAAR